MFCLLSLSEISCRYFSWQHSQRIIFSSEKPVSAFRKNNKIQILTEIKMNMDNPVEQKPNQKCGRTSVLIDIFLKPICLH